MKLSCFNRQESRSGTERALERDHQTPTTITTTNKPPPTTTTTTTTTTPTPTPTPDQREAGCQPIHGRAVAQGRGLQDLYADLQLVADRQPDKHPRRSRGAGGRLLPAPQHPNTPSQHDSHNVISLFCTAVLYGQLVFCTAGVLEWRVTNAGRGGGPRREAALAQQAWRAVNRRRPAPVD